MFRGPSTSWEIVSRYRLGLDEDKWSVPVASSKVTLLKNERSEEVLTREVILLLWAHSHVCPAWCLGRRMRSYHVNGPPAFWLLMGFCWGWPGNRGEEWERGGSGGRGEGGGGQGRGWGIDSLALPATSPSAREGWLPPWAKVSAPIYSALSPSVDVSDGSCPCLRDSGLKLSSCLISCLVSLNSVTLN